MDVLEAYKRFLTTLFIISLIFMVLPHVVDSLVLMYWSIWWAVFIIMAFLSSYLSYDGHILRRMFLLYLHFEEWLKKIMGGNDDRGL